VTALSATSRAEDLRAIADRLGVRATAVGRGEKGELDALATRDDVDLVLVASPGIAGLRPTLAALRAGKAVALANKEVLVAGGHLVTALAGGAGERLRPIDSEHSALWQALAGERLADVQRVVLTASGGPVRERPLADLAHGARAPNDFARLDLVAAGVLRFREIESARYPCLGVILETARSGDRAAMVGLSAADEIAVERFLRHEIAFSDIASYLRRGADLGARQGVRGDPDLDTTLRIDAAVRGALAKEPVVA